MTDATTLKPANERAILGRFTQNYGEKKGFFSAVGESSKQGFGDIKNAFGKDASWGARGAGFARIGGVGVGVAMAGDSLFRGKTSDGEDRSGLARVGQAVLGTGIAVGSLVVGRGR